jgi:hypothetical protein
MLSRIPKYRQVVDTRRIGLWTIQAERRLGTEDALIRIYQTS